MRPLEQTQREFFAALQMPLRGRSRRSTELPPSDEGHSAGFLAKADELMKAGSNLSSAERLELYHRQYWFRVLDSIAEDFPVLRKMAGEEIFWALMEAYLLECPSSSFTLRHLGSRVADFTAEWEVIDESRRRWFSAIARLEYAEMEIYEAAEWEAVPPDQLAGATLGLQPHVKLLALPVEADLCNDWESFSPIRETPVHLAVWRGENGGAIRCRLDPVEFELLTRLRNHSTLAGLFSEPTEREPEPQDVSSWFANWQSRRWIALPPAADVEDFAVVSHRSVKDVDWSRIDKMGSQARAMED
ncbi:putative DNA-binding domain-containing protein [Luteolibacter yonseiensis]|uniref:DNA-binding domain-containing protein n=1 Tax=Luteolibacter yonseiensis TaxID=1144680 RepID=A0A934V8G4_9BACT|nr:putative DNA-binding domain-containing protein [Luteolibacter yonseiensis]MBK1817237.1 putative DNA-binding domain-containing protein [Luteolibacter yonseiensis]